MFTRHVSKELSAYCNGELTEENSRRVREHLSACEKCRKDYDEINLGVQLASQITLAAAPEDLWRDIEEALDNTVRASRLTVARPAFAFNWYRVAFVSAALLIAIVVGVVWRIDRRTREGWDVNNIVGTVRIGGDRTTENGKLTVGETLETGGASQAKIIVGSIGEVDVDPDTRVRLVEAKLTEHRLALEHGKLSANVSAPPRLFIVDTPSAEAVDLGCAYTLEQDDAGKGLLHVTYGEVALVRGGREVWVPRYAMCQTRVGIGPGTPYFEDASQALVASLVQFDFENGGQAALENVLKEARQRDTFTLWHLLSSTDGDQRVQVLNRMIELVGLPKGISREKTLQLDPRTLEAWKDEMDTIWF